MPAGHEQEEGKKIVSLSQMICAPGSQHSFNGKVTFCLIKMQRKT